MVLGERGRRDARFHRDRDERPVFGQLNRRQVGFRLRPTQGPDQPTGEQAFAKEEAEQDVAIVGLLGLQEEETRQAEAKKSQQADGHTCGAGHPRQARYRTTLAGAT